ncbi:MAG: isochorismate synthase [Deltaproteobacteria bacterium]|nr:isochorismate synthase [Deltaproteobacteria bacterium]
MSEASSSARLGRFWSRSALDVWSFVRGAGRQGEAVWVARLPNGSTFGAVGAVLEVAVDGPDRFAKALELDALKEHFAERGTCPPEETLRSAPIAVGGFAFGDTPLGQVWRGFPGLWWWVPRLLWVGTPTGTWVGTTGATEMRPAPARSTQVGTDEPRQAFEARVARAIDALGGDLSKVVLARSLTLAGRFDVRATFETSAVRDDSAMCFAVGRLGGSMFTGASPEPLIELDGDQIRTLALAGTRAQGVGRAAELLESAKDRVEHEHVAQALEAALAEGCHEVFRGPTSIRSAADLLHLATPISGRTQGGTLFSWMEKLHPSPAVVGAPRKAAMAHLERHEPLQRGWYTGAIGYVHKTGGGAWVAIRSALLGSNAATLYAGAGIVRGSDPAKEWLETEQKLSSILRALRQEAP